MPMYNLLEYYDNYADSSRSLYQFKRDEQNINADRNLSNATTRDSSSFNYKSNLLRRPDTTGVLRNAKILRNFFRSLEMPLINCKIHLELNWRNNCVIFIIGNTTFQITSIKLYVPIVTLSNKDNVNLTKQLNEGFKRPAYWNEHKFKVETKNLGNNNVTRFPLDASFQRVNRLFVLAFDNTDNGLHKVERDSHRNSRLQ